MPPIEFAHFLLAATDVREPLVPLWALEFAADTFLAVWLFWVGACVGSFLNVVVYRLPRGINLIHPASRCPSCLHPIRLRDNIPLLSWLLLGGKCRDCRVAISSRYFWVELLVASVFLFTGAVEAFIARPHYVPPELFSGRPLLSPHDALPFWCAYATHVGLITTLLGAALIDWDGFRTPRRMFLPLLLLGLALPLLWPQIRRIPAARDWNFAGWSEGLLDGLAGLAAGLLMGLLFGAGWWLGSRGRGWPKFAPATMLAATGAVTGWQRVLQVGSAPLIIFLGMVLMARLARLKNPLPFAVVPAIYAWFMLVELDSDVGFTIHLAESGLGILAMAAFTFLMATACGAIAPNPYFENTPPRTESAGEPTASDISLDHSDQPLIAPSSPATTHEPNQPPR